MIEDDPALATLLAECLALDDLEVESVPTGELGLERALAQPPAVICLDIGLAGELDGWQVLPRLSANQVTAHIPVLVCTGENGRRTATALGAADVLGQAVHRRPAARSRDAAPLCRARVSAGR